MMNNLAMTMDRRISTEEPEYRLTSKIIAILDIISALATLFFHVYTIATQEIVEDAKTRLSDGSHVLVPLTPVQMQLHGYLLVLSWIGIFTVNIVQLIIGCTLYRATSPHVEATKGLSGSRTWIKTNIFLLILLVFKLVILYFMSEMGTKVTFTTLFCAIEFIGRGIGLVIVMKYLHALTLAFPDISQIYYDAAQMTESPKRNPVTDAVWF